MMKKRYRLQSSFFVFILLAVFSSVVATSAARAAEGYGRIDGAELRAMMADGKAVIIVDVREPRLYGRGHIPGAILIPFDGARERVLKELKPADRIVFVCHGGPMGDELGALLARNGYRRVYNLKGGMRRWSGPTVK